MRVRKLAAYAASMAPLASQAMGAYVPGAPVIHFVRSANPSGAADSMAPAATDMSTGTVYYSQKLDPFSKAHETGHVFDSEVLDSGERSFFQRLMHAPGGQWDQGTGVSGYHSPDEWFADYYAAAANHLDLSKQGVSSYATIGPKRLKRFEAALARLGQRKNLQSYRP